MAALSRRTFFSWVGGLAAASGLRGEIAAEPRPSEPGGDEYERQGGGLDPVLLTHLGEAVLPAELGDIDIARVSRAFSRWVAAYPQGAELSHPYGSATIRFAGGSPVGRWRPQLDALQRAADGRFGRPFASISRDQRRELVQAALADERVERMPSPLAAGHVALALLAWYFTTPEATDLCYRARINAGSCRPLLTSGREPLPLVRGP
jgi:hypothetical protein